MIEDIEQILLEYDAILFSEIAEKSWSSPYKFSIIAKLNSSKTFSSKSLQGCFNRIFAEVTNLQIDQDNVCFDIHIEDL